MFLNSPFFAGFSQLQPKKFIFDKKVNLIVGPNSSGKTNILEAVFLLSRGKSFRAKLEEEMITYQAPLSIIETKIFQENEKKDLKIILTRGKIQEKKVAKKIFKVNEVGKRLFDFIGNLKAVLFRPEDIEIIIGSPSIRRDYLNSVLELVDRQYRLCYLVYQKALKQRNKILDFIREGKAKENQLEYWNRLLVKNGEIITRKREEVISFFNSQFFVFKQEGEFPKLQLEYDRSAISMERLLKYHQAEIALGATLVGPHRDEVKFQIVNSYSEISRDLAKYGSRGEQRMAILALKIAELIFIEKKAQEKPLLLLDDIFSELDSKHRDQVFDLIDDYQAILTATEKIWLTANFS